MNSLIVHLNKNILKMKRNEPNFKQFTKLNQQNLSFVKIYSLSGVLLKCANGTKAALAMKQSPYHSQES
jgi:hypothetical protein